MIGKRAFILTFAKYFLPILLVVSLLSYFFYRMDKSGRLMMIQSHSLKNVQTFNKLIATDLNNGLADLHFLAHIRVLQEYLDEPSASNRSRLAALFQSFASAKQVYDQIRYLDLSGQEQVRINYAQSHAHVVTREKLQNKQGRYYVTEIQALKPGEHYLSALDLNMEQGEIERPFKPMLRFGTLVQDANGATRGMILLNYRAERLLGHIKGQGRATLGSVMMLNQAGYWLVGRANGEAWGFMLPDRADKRFQNSFPIAWDRIKPGKSGQIHTKEGLFTFDTLYPLSLVNGDHNPQQPAQVTPQTMGSTTTDPSYQWKIVSHVPQHKLESVMADLQQAIVTLYGIVMFVIALVIIMTVRAQMRDRRSVHAMTQQRRELDKTREELIQTEKMASLGRLVAGFAHEINTPIGVAVGATSQLEELAQSIEQLLQQDEVDEEILLNHLTTIREASALSFSNINRAAHMIRSFKRSSADQASLSTRRFNVSQSIHDVVTSLHNSLKQSPIKIDIECNKELTFYSVPGVLEQVLTNLLGNSQLHAYDEGNLSGRIRILVELTPQQHLHLLYSDDGRGMDEQTLREIFTPFYTTKPNAGGTGLGLYICQNLIEDKLGGEIHCTSEPGEGTQFSFTIPPSDTHRE
uniref:histidine kinase n=1 Tax=Magnetococcus massalia (strain MO-1) TaxID=451514 RepID=A0A1S7LFS3_MAGMO|nr:Putative sensor histidine kinase [Candidatus Magnetococcus massalia]